MRAAFTRVSRQRGIVGAADGCASGNPTLEGREPGPDVTRTAKRRQRVFILLTLWVLACTTFHVFVVMSVYSNAVVLLQYYAINYKYGFVRRGLAGELIRIFPEHNYFDVAYAILWASAITWLICLAFFVWLVLKPNPGSERRRMLALLVPVLPFSVSYLVYNAHPEIWGMSALVIFSIAVRSAGSRRSRVIYCVIYGATGAVFTLIHEAMAVQFALGAVLAITVLAKDTTSAAKRLLSLLAVGPGLLALVFVAMLGRRDTATSLCTQIPHGLVDDPVGTYDAPHRSLSFLFGQFQHQSDFHDWVCTKTMPFFYMDIFDGARVVASYGLPKLFASLVLGIAILFLTLSAVRYVCGVSARSFAQEIYNDRRMVLLSIALLLPLFVTAVDWTRWYTVIALDITTVYILYAIERPEIDQRVTRRDWQVFVAAVVVFAAIPFGNLNNVGS